MHPNLRDFFDIHLAEAKRLMRDGKLRDAFSKLEIAHILGQRFVWPHTQTHFWMLVVGIRQRNLKEVLGQLYRLPFGAIGSAIDVVPTGNTGGSNVSAFRKMEIPTDLKKWLNLDNG